MLIKGDISLCRDNIISCMTTAITYISVPMFIPNNYTCTSTFIHVGVRALIFFLDYSQEMMNLPDSGVFHNSKLYDIIYHV